MSSPAVHARDSASAIRYASAVALGPKTTPSARAADQVRDRRAGLGHDLARAVARRERAAEVADPRPVRGRDRLDHRDGNLRARRAVQVRVPVRERRVEGAHRGDVE